jgi:hypothetical protein
MPQNGERREQGAQWAWRVTFTRTEDVVRPGSVHRLAMVAPPGEQHRLEAGMHGGAWVELRDRAGAVLYQRALGLRLDFAREAPAEPGSGGMHWVSISRTPFVFDVLVPDLTNGVTLVLLGNLDDGRAEAGELVQVRLAEGQPDQGRPE